MFYAIFCIFSHLIRNNGGNYARRKTAFASSDRGDNFLLKTVFSEYVAYFADFSEFFNWKLRSRKYFVK